jgi:uncharacterized protein YndB with AHSA1/START domain
MPVKIDASGRRSVEAEVEVPGTPEEVWKAVATGRGISSWFVPTKVEEKVGGTIANSFGPGMDALATVITWEPPRRLVAESPGETGPTDPTVATEWTVEARAGGTCVVRVVHSWTSATGDWDDQFEGHTHGWRGFFRILRLYLAHFSGQPCAAMQQLPSVPEPKLEAWTAFMGALGLAPTDRGQRVTSKPGAPRLAGVVESMGEPAFPELLLRLDQPAPGIAHLFALPMGGRVFLTTRLYLYGEQAAATIAQEEPKWQAWLAANLPAQAAAPPGPG